MPATCPPWSEAYKKKVISPPQLADKIQLLRQQNKTIATLNGSFDLLHAGHLHSIFEASKVADLLIVALNSDRSIQQYKSPHRPIVPLEYRIQMMAALEFVDYVTWFEETDPRQLLSLIRPDVHVNGAEYGENCIEAEVVKSNGGRLHIVQLIPGLSTSALLQKIRTEPNACA
jgi:D-glycero-beta-D-manno-heptose 1-phosphate adenylyltransferase